jgi:hypothetical protein
VNVVEKYELTPNLGAESRFFLHVPKNPVKRRINLMRELHNIQDEYNAIAADYLS